MLFVRIMTPFFGQNRQPTKTMIVILLLVIVFLLGGWTALLCAIGLFLVLGLLEWLISE